MKYRIFVENVLDRDETVKILAKNGYTVRIGREKAKTGSRYLHFVEYWGSET